MERFFVLTAFTKTSEYAGRNANAVISGTQIVVRAATFCAIRATTHTCADFISPRIRFN